MARILSYGCRSWGGLNTEQYWQSLSTGITSLTHPTAESLIDSLMHAWHEAKPKFLLSQNFGVIYASTKGPIDDLVWDPLLTQDSIKLKTDLLNETLELFLKKTELRPALTLCVSNACASSLAALYLANEWLLQKRVDQVIVITGDRVGEFVQKGFKSLNALSQTTAQPFSETRDGLSLGEAAAVIVLGENESKASNQALFINHIGIDTEGYAVTRPSPSGSSLKRAYTHAQFNRTTQPDLIIAHGTATQLNDEIEDQVFTHWFGAGTVPVTGTKWNIGHSLGASGAMDVIAACEAIAHQSAFGLGKQTTQIDSKFKNQYLQYRADEKTNLHSMPLSKVLVSSLGFGGTHAVAEITRMPETKPIPIEEVFDFAQREITWKFKFPVQEEPIWKEKVDRWYQLDAFSYGLAEFYSKHAAKLGPKPSLIFLASPAASNDTDFQFVRTGAISPGKFVHTLPNVRGSALCQVMDWAGPLLCLQHGSNTHASAVREAHFLIDEINPCIWVLGVEGNALEQPFTVRATLLSAAAPLTKEYS